MYTMKFKYQGINTKLLVANPPEQQLKRGQFATGKPSTIHISVGLS
jgi:hypothetical protein